MLKNYKQHVFYLCIIKSDREELCKKATNISRDKLLSLGVCFGKFTKSGKFHLQITCLDYLAQYCTFKVWIKPNGEQSFLYGNHIAKAHIAKMSDDTPEHTGVIVFSSSNVPLGFGTTAKCATEIGRMDPTALSIFHQADIGEYLRQEDTLL